MTICFLMAVFRVNSVTFGRICEMTKKSLDSYSTHPESFSLLSDFDIHLFKDGKHYRLYDKLGAHVVHFQGKTGTYFAVWAPSAKQVSVIGNFNYWTAGQHQLRPRWDESGIWEGFFEHIGKGEVYKYAIISPHDDCLEKADPFGFYHELPPRTASIVWDHEYVWSDQQYMEVRKQKAGTAQPMAVYEVHAGSWRRNPEEGNRSLTYREMINELVPYVKEAGFTHVEFLPMMEHPFSGSWGYQITGYYASTSRFGEPQDFMALIDAFHQEGIGVILDWVPSHFPGDMHGLFRFDGTHLFEHADPRQGFHPDWSSYIYNYGRNEVRAFLISNALFWLERFHIDGIRVDAVASMLYLDYSRRPGEWIPNRHGGNENLEAIQFLKELNVAVYGAHPDAITIAEESTAWPGISRPTFMGGLGFGQKWMMGWMHDTLMYLRKDPIHRKFHQNDITFSIIYAFTENFMLPLSHDEVVHGKGSLLSRMPGDEWQMFANLRLLFAYMYVHPGTKLIFMGGEIGQYEEWNHDSSLRWDLLNRPLNKGLFNLLSDLNSFYKEQAALWRFAFEPQGFQWIDYSDRENSVMAFQRNSDKKEDQLIVVINFTPIVRHQYHIGVPEAGDWEEVFTSDRPQYGGSGVTNGTITTTTHGYHGHAQSLSLALPPLAVSIFRKK
ncbi:MAG: 1,4-alpha-glucan branching protein GlgB [Bacteroidota bacterium]